MKRPSFGIAAFAVTFATSAAFGGLPVADVNAALWRARDEERPVKSLFLTQDGVHMNKRGQSLLARKFDVPCP